MRVFCKLCGNELEVDESRNLMGEYCLEVGSCEECAAKVKNVRDIVRLYLKQHGFDGFFNNDPECVCTVDNLMPCYGYIDQCRPGYKVPCPPECGEHDFHIAPKEGGDE